MFLTREDVLVSVLVFVLLPLALFATVEKFALLLLQGLNGKKQGLLLDIYLSNIYGFIHLLI